MSLHDYATNAMHGLGQHAAFGRARYWRGFAHGAAVCLVGLAFFIWFWSIGGTTP